METFHARTSWFCGLKLRLVDELLLNKTQQNCDLWNKGVLTDVADVVSDFIVSRLCHKSIQPLPDITRLFSFTALNILYLCDQFL